MTYSGNKWETCNLYFLRQCFSKCGSHAAAKSLQSCPALSDPMGCNPPGSPIPGILQARTLEWVAISFSNAWKWKVKVKLLSCVQLLATPWTAAYQAPPSMGQGKLDRESTMIELRGHRRLRNRVAAPGRVRREPQRKRRGSGSWPARHCACVSTTRVGAGVEAFD